MHPMAPIATGATTCTGIPRAVRADGGGRLRCDHADLDDAAGFPRRCQRDRACGDLLRWRDKAPSRPARARFLQRAYGTVCRAAVRRREFSSGGNYCELRMPFRTSVRVAVTGTPPYFDIGYETYPAGTPVRTFRPYATATLRNASDHARLLSRAGTDPIIIPAGGRQYVGHATIASEGGSRLADILASRPRSGRSRSQLVPLDDVSLQEHRLDARLGLGAPPPPSPRRSPTSS